MAQSTFAFEQPAIRKLPRLQLGPWLLVFGTVMWCVLYAAMGWRFWERGIDLDRPLDAWLIVTCLVLGVGVLVGWWRTLAALRSSRRNGAWPALSLEQLHALTPSQFEAYVAYHLFTRRGYYADNVRDVKDGGIDILVRDPYGQQAVVQCKRYRGTVGAPIVRDLYGTMIHAGAAYAYLVTNSTFSEEARQWAAGKPIELIDGPQLVELSRTS